MATPRVETEYPVELTAPDISPCRRGKPGTEFATTYDSGFAGPHARHEKLNKGFFDQSSQEIYCKSSSASPQGHWYYLRDYWR
jgi:hypothetical protein